MNELTERQSKIHEEIVATIERLKKVEWRIIELLQEAETAKLPQAFECRSLFTYATKILKLEADQAYPLITLARKAKIIPELSVALRENRLSTSKANRIVSIIEAKNAAELVQFATTHTKREIEFEVARRNPRAAIERVKPVSEDRIEVTLSFSKSEYEKLLRVQSLEARRNPKVTRSEAACASFDAYLFKHDPVAKADRSILRNTSSHKNDESLCPGRVKNSSVHEISEKRRPLTAAQKHAAHFINRGKCTHVFPDGTRCDEDRYTELHHVIEVSRGGSNHPSNLTSLCRFHHQLLHRKKSPIPTFDEWIEQCAPTEVFIN